MRKYALSSPLAGRKAFVCSLAAALLTGTALPALAATAPISTQAQDLGPVSASTPLTGMVWLKTHNEAQFDAAVASRYDVNSASFHRWMTAEEVAKFTPSAADVEAVKASLKALGLKVGQVSDDGAAIKVSGSASQLQAAFGTQIHVKQAAGKSFLATLAEPKYQGAHAELVDSISSLGSVGMRPYYLRQTNLATGAVGLAVPAATNANPLAFFTDQCFGPQETKKLVGENGEAVTYKGPQYTPNGFTAACGYTAQQVATHYGLDAVYAKGWTGKGQTIVIVDAFGSPSITNDANTFNKAMGLSPLTNKNFSIVFPDGQPLGTDNGWAGETSLDVEWAHALAPDAKIVLVVAPTADDTELAFAVNYAVAHKLGNVISNSYGEVEVEHGPAVARQYNTVFKKAAAQGIAVNVATGDDGDFGLGTPLGAASIPADSPFATGVGGTSIDIPSDTGLVEAAWGINLTILATALPEIPPFITGFAQGGGGGQSIYLEKPAFQKSLPGTGRQLPDVSALADPQTGAIVVVPDALTGEADFTVIGGTSLATPIFSAIWTLANQAAGESLGQAAPVIAKMASGAVTDILPISASKAKDNTAGSIVSTDPSTGIATTTTYDPAQLLGLDVTQPEGFVGMLAPSVGLVELYDLGFGADSSLMATTGWDNATGWGVPNGLKFINAAKKAAKGTLN
ncbi:MAG TPA: S53 family peptidase [Aliidongia sp.]|nr:S53 family peptidase [Aliidongia sp.]